MDIAVPPSPHGKFVAEAAGRFRVGHVFRPDEPVPGDEQLTAEAAGYWHCTIADGDRLSWDERVYELFGLPAGTGVDRNMALSRYSKGSRLALDRLRSFSIRQQCGFIFDAVMMPEAGARWMRVLSVPIVSDGQVVALHGLKRAL